MECEELAAPSHCFCFWYKLRVHRKFPPHSFPWAQASVSKPNCLVVSCCAGHYVVMPLPCCSDLPMRFCLGAPFYILGLLRTQIAICFAWTLNGSSLHAHLHLRSQPVHLVSYILDRAWGLSLHIHISK